jgi:hypothetical protein
MPESASERFARAVEGGPVEPDLDESLRHELALVDALRDIGRSARLDDDARQRLREQLLAGIDDRLDPRPRPQAMPEPSRSARARVARARVASVRGRLLVAAAAALCLLVSLSAMSLLMARDALPGDALYGVKRSAESAELGFTFGVESRGFKHLQFATARLDELEARTKRCLKGSTPTRRLGPGCWLRPRPPGTATCSARCVAGPSSRLSVSTWPCRRCRSRRRFARPSRGSCCAGSPSGLRRCGLAWAARR